jgi:Tat protein secretion system quality control protein TatD with DNase activity
MRSAAQVPSAPAAAAASDLSSFACPCCQFRLPEEGLFLPSNGAECSSGAQRCATTRRTTQHTPRSTANAGEAYDNSDESPLPRDAYDILLEKFMRKQEEGGPEDEADCTFPFLMVDTHCHAHLDRENRPGDGIYVLPDEIENEEENDGVGNESTGLEGDEITNDRRAMDSSRRPRLTSVVSLTCAVAPSDWNACLAHAAASPRRICALGVHPWYLDNILDLEPNGESNANDPSHSSKAANEASSPTQSPPLPTPLDVAIARGDLLEKLRALLLEHPGCLVGEIGLCKQARFVRTYEGGKAEALGLQREVFRAQLLLACQLRRSASVHCVNQHSVLLEVLQSLVERLLANRQRQQHEAGPELAPPAMYMPPAIALHSFTGTANQVRQLLAWEAQLPVEVRCPVPWVGDNGGEAAGESTRQPTAPLLYFGFSHAVNVAMGSSSAKSRRQGRDAVRAVPSERLLAESDVSTPNDVAGGIAYLAATAHDDEEFGTKVMPADSLLRMAKLTSENGIRFLRQQQARQRGDE